MQQYNTQYGTIFAVREYKGHPAIMLREEHKPDDWSLSSMIEPFTPGAWTAEELQGQLDSWAATKGWQPVEEPASAEPPEIVDESSGPEEGCPYLQPLENSRKYTCQCSISGDKFANREICNKSFLVCGWYQDRQDKEAQTEDGEEDTTVTDSCHCRTCKNESCFAHGCTKECPANAEESCLATSCPEYSEKGQNSADADGFPDWVRPMVETFLQFDFIRGLPAFTAAAFKNSEPVQHHQGGSLAGGLYDTGPKGIKFSVFRGDNSDQYREASYTWAGFVRRCKAAGLAPEPLTKDKEDVPCKTETPAPTGAAAATTAASAVPMPSTAAGTSTTSESGAGASNSPDSPSARADMSPRDTKTESNAPATPTTAMAASGNGLLPAFDYSGLPTDTAEHLQNLARRAAQAKQRYILDMMEIVVEAHRELCDTVVARCDNGKFTKKEDTFRDWCASIGVGKDTAYRLLQVQALMDGSTPEEQEVLADAPAKLLYAAAKPSAPAELVQAVKDGDITTNKQYQEALAEIRARDAKITDLLEMSEAADRRADKAEQAAKDTARERDTALRRAAEAEKQRDGARDALQAAKLRGDKLKAENDALKAHPIEAQVVDEEEIDRRAQARADELTAPLREELEALRARHPADPEEAEQAIRDAYDSAVYTGRVIESAWRSLCPLLPRMDADRRVMAVRQLEKILTKTQEELRKCL